MTGTGASPGSPRRIVILVHGTQLLRALATAVGRWREARGWAKPGSTCRLWCEHGQPFRHQLQTELGADTLIVDVPWSGGNRHSSRQRAVVAVLRAMATHKGGHPDAPLYIVGHSHGGNIARDILLEESVQPLVNGIVCLSTPFLYARLRPRPEKIE